MKIPSTLCFGGLLLCAGPAIAQSEEEYDPAAYEEPLGSEYEPASGGGSGAAGSDWTDLSWDLTTLWQSRFVTEGRRRVQDASFLMTTAEGHFGPLNLGAWWAQALTETSYNRFDLYADTSLKFDPGELTLGIRRVLYPTGKDNNSWEGNVGFDFNLGTWFTPFALTYFDVDEIGGGFLEAGVKAPFKLAGDSLEIEPFGLLGVDYGYVSGDNDPRMNNLQFGAEIRWNVNPRWQIYGNINHSFSLSLLDSRNEGDLTWGGTGLRFSF